MRNSTSSLLKQEFLKKWIMGMQICGSSLKSQSILERKNAIKLSADLAMASVRQGKTTCWSRALITNSTHSNKPLVHRILTKIHSESLLMSSKTAPFGGYPSSSSSKRVCHKKIVRRCKKVLRSKRRGDAFVKRMRLLRKVLPGGEFLKDEFCLIRETLDYVVSLRAQVDVMRCLVNAANDSVEKNI